MPIINETDAAEFLANVNSSAEVFTLRVPELRVLGAHLGVTNCEQLNKNDLIFAVTRRAFHDPDGTSSLPDHLPGSVDDLDPPQGEDNQVNQPAPAAQPMLVATAANFAVQLQIQLEREKANTLDKQIHLAQLNNFRPQTPVPVDDPVDESSPFNFSAAVKLVPSFSEGNVEDFFASFERLARRLQWPNNLWTILLQQALSGKALRVYVSLSDHQAEDYQTVKDEILRAYALIPESYRRKFRNYQKFGAQTYLEFASRKRDALMKWLNSSDVDNFQSLVNLVLVEDFIRSVPREVSNYLLDKEFTTVEQAAKYADGYALAHHKQPNRDSTTLPNTFSKSYSSSSPSTKRKFYDARQGSAKPKQTNATQFRSPDQSKSKKFTCNFCGKQGHTADFCWQRLKVHDKPKPVHTLIRSDTYASSPSDSRGVLVSQDTGPSDKDFVPRNSFSTAAADFSSKMDSLAPCASPTAASKPVAFVLPPGQKCDSLDPNLGTFNAFLSKGTILVDEEYVPVTVLRDSASLMTCLREGVVPPQDTGKYVVLTTLCGQDSFPLYRVEIKTRYFSGPAWVAILPKLPGPNVDILLGNDLAGGKVFEANPFPVLQSNPISTPALEQIEGEMPDVFPLCAVTRSMSAARQVERSSSEQEKQEKTDECDLTALFGQSFCFNPSTEVTTGRSALIAAQKEDPSLQQLWEDAHAGDGTTGPTTRYVIQEGVLYRRWVPPTVPKEDQHWAAVSQVVLPTGYRKPMLELAHDGRFSGHLGPRKTYLKLAQKYFWPGIRKDVTDYVSKCFPCQKVGAPSARIPPFPLVKVPVISEPFTTLQLDVVGPLPKTSRGNEYLLTILDLATRYPHAVPLRSISANIIVRALLDFCTHFGMPSTIQTDGASYFTGHKFNQALKEWGIRHRVSSPYHPQTQGAIERSHQTMKSILRKYIVAFNTSWDDNLPYMLYVMRDTPCATLGFSPFELLFAHTVRGPLYLAREHMLGNPERCVSVLQLVGDMREKLLKMWSIAADTLQDTQRKTKAWYDKRARHREFQLGDPVLVLLPTPGQPLQAKFRGPYRVVKKISPTNYVISTPDGRRSQRLCHINSLKAYHPRDEEEDADVRPVQATLTEPLQEEDEVSDSPLPMSSVNSWAANTSVLAQKLDHLPTTQRADILRLVAKYSPVFEDQPRRTSLIEHDIDVGDSAPIKTPPYRVHPSRVLQVTEELDKMLAMGIIKPHSSPWCSPITLVPKRDGSWRFCVDYRKVNTVTRKDGYPLPRVDDCIEAVGQAKYITKLDCLRGFWQVPLSQRAKDISTFAVLGKTYAFQVMPFGLCNAPATFTKLMTEVTAGIPGCACYLDDIVVYSQDWDDHLHQLDQLFHALQKANLVVNLAKSFFVCAQLEYLGHLIGRGSLVPPDHKSQAIQTIPAPTNRRQIRRFLGTVGYYRRYILNFASLALPLTELLKKGTPYKWSQECEKSFQSLKDVLCSQPVLRAPDFNRPFKLACDASDLAAGSVLLQEDDSGVEHPVAFYSKKFTPAQTRYSTVEKELLSLILSLQHFEYYLVPQAEIHVYTDHKPLRYLNNFHSNNQRLTRWSLYLQNFNLKIQHIKGLDNVLPDLLSRA